MTKDRNKYRPRPKREKPPTGWTPENWQIRKDRERNKQKGSE